MTAMAAGKNAPSFKGDGSDRSDAGECLHLRLPGTSANLGPGFDTLALALSFALEVEAVRATEFSLQATGRDQEICSSLKGNLILEVYEKTLKGEGVAVRPLGLAIHNEIPIGKGFGSSAAARLAGIVLANHFGGLGWSSGRILDEASRMEGHPDNVAACWLGGFAVATEVAGKVHAVKISGPVGWRVLLVAPELPLATKTARAVLPGSYERGDAVFNLQRACLLTAAFAGGRGDLLRVAMEDRFHQPFRAKICPLLAGLLPLAGSGGVLGASLSGAGPSVLLLLDEGTPMEEIRARVWAAVGNEQKVELLECSIEENPAAVFVYGQEGVVRRR